MHQKKITLKNSINILGTNLSDPSWKQQFIRKKKKKTNSVMIKSIFNTSIWVTSRGCAAEMCLRHCVALLKKAPYTVSVGYIIPSYKIDIIFRFLLSWLFFFRSLCCSMSVSLSIWCCNVSGLIPYLNFFLNCVFYLIGQVSQHLSQITVVLLS